MRLTLRVAAAVVLVVGGWCYYGGARPVAPLAFAEVAEKLRDARTLAFRLTVQIPGAKAPVTVRLFFKDPGLIRSEAEGPGSQVLVIDRDRGRTLILTPAAKSAMLVEGKKSGGPKTEEEVAAREIDHLRALTGKKGEPAGTEQIGGVKAQGFRVRSDGGPEQTIWADPKTGRPVRIDSTVRVGGQEVHSVLSDVEIDPKLDDSLFRLEPPAGYKLLTLSSGAGSVEDDVAWLLRLYASKSGGTFPNRLDDWAAYDKQLGEGYQPKAGRPPTSETTQLMERLIRVNIFLFQHRAGGYGYRADGVKLGDANAIVFWYKPNDGPKYRAVYGDLHVGDLTADQLPHQR